MNNKRKAPKSAFKKGCIPWNKGKTGFPTPSGAFKRGNIPWNKGKKWSIKIRKKIAETLKNYEFTEEHRKRIKESAKKNPNYGMKGKKHSQETKLKISQNRKNKNVGVDNPEWKGEDAGIKPIHKWVARHKGCPKKCEFCGTIERKIYDWANIDHKYKRNLNDYIRLCRSCHKKYDNKRKLNLSYT